MRKTVRIFKYLPSEELVIARRIAKKIPSASITDGDDVFRVSIKRPDGADDRAAAREFLLQIVAEDEIAENQVARQDSPGEPELSVIFGSIETKPDFICTQKVSALAEIETFLE